jgi:MoaA/NifB/PqqE/SkfB family radical SAM enzyme
VSTTIDLVRLYARNKSGIAALAPSRPHPFRATIRPTENCQARCISCNYWESKWDDAVTKDRWVEVIGQLRGVGIKRLRFSGGEPLLRLDLFDILDEIKDLGLSKITLATNGMLLNKMADQVSASCLTDLGVSVDGMSEKNDVIRGIKGYFDLSTAGLRKVEGKRATIMTTLMSSNADDIGSLIDMCEDEGWKWDFNLLDNSLPFLVDANLVDLWPDPDQIQTIFGAIDSRRELSALSRINDVQLRYAKRHYARDIKVEEQPSCFLGYTDVDINSAGDLFSGCYPLPAVGNIIRSDVKEILYGPAYAKRLAKMVARDCPGCTCGYEVNVAIASLPSYAVQRILHRKVK